MAISPSHRFGQIIGEVFENALEPLLRRFADEHKLFLDKKGVRKARRGKKASWTDEYGNTHDLDFVLERGGSDEKTGTPVAFVEVAWRRYTKHSRNKAQEIQGAIGPLVETYRHSGPFAGAILAGVFTNGALEQLKSQKFAVLYFPYELVITAFKSVGIDAFYDEDTADRDFAKKVRRWDALPGKDKTKVAIKLLMLNKEAIELFMTRLTEAVVREIQSIRILYLHGAGSEWKSAEEAIKFIEQYKEEGAAGPFVRFEIEVRYKNGDKISGEFQSKDAAINFLQAFQIRPPTIITHLKT